MEIEVFENQKKLFDSAQCETVQSRTRHSFTLPGVQLRAVLDTFGSAVNFNC